MRIEHHHGAYRITGRRYGPDGFLVQTDWDYPAVACELGWNMRRVQRDNRTGNSRILSRAPNRGHGCDHNSTDGTITCECGLTATQFIGAAREYLDSLC